MVIVQMSRVANKIFELIFKDKLIEFQTKHSVVIKRVIKAKKSKFKFVIINIMIKWGNITSTFKTKPVADVQISVNTTGVIKTFAITTENITLMRKNIFMTGITIIYHSYQHVTYKQSIIARHNSML